MAEDFLRAKIAVLRNEQEVNLTVAELGVMLTALNRSLNKMILDDPKIRGQFSSYPLSYQAAYAEPVFLQLRITTVRQGSFELHAAIELLAAVGLDPANAKALLLGILANALYDPKRTQTLINDFRRALQRVARGATGKIVKVIIALNDKAVGLYGQITDEGKVRARLEPATPDDIQ